MARCNGVNQIYIKVATPCFLYQFLLRHLSGCISWVCKVLVHAVVPVFSLQLCRMRPTSVNHLVSTYLSLRAWCNLCCLVRERPDFVSTTNDHTEAMSNSQKQPLYFCGKAYSLRVFGFFFNKESSQTTI